MILIDEVLIHEDVLKQPFSCDLEKCKGACCWKGDYGAPVSPAETEAIKAILPLVKSELPQDNIDRIEEQGVDVYYKGMDKKGTPLMPDGACAFLIREGDGAGVCAFEKIWEEGKTDFKKPISCHLYPIRIEHSDRTGMDFVNYDRWDICNPACHLGKKLSQPLFEFCAEALDRKYGPEFLEKLREVDTALKEDSKFSTPSL